MQTSDLLTPNKIQDWKNWTEPDPKSLYQSQNEIGKISDRVQNFDTRRTESELNQKRSISSIRKYLIELCKYIIIFRYNIQKHQKYSKYLELSKILEKN